MSDDPATKPTPADPPKPEPEDKKDADSAAQPNTTPPPVPPADKVAAPATESASIKDFTPERVQEKQRSSRAENQDWMRALEQFFATAIPRSYLNNTDRTSIYINNINANDMFMGARGFPNADIAPPPDRGTAQVSRVDARKIQQVYQRHSGYARALKILKDGGRCIVLKGKPLVGKWAAAVHLALELRGEQATIVELSGEENLLVQIKRTEIKQRAVYIVHDLLREQGRAISRSTVAAISDILQEKDAHLIICAKLEVPLPPEQRQILFEPLPASTTSAVLEAHLLYYEKEISPEQIKKGLEHEQVASVFKTGLPPSQVDVLAQLLAMPLKDDLPLEEALRGFTGVVATEVQSWFDETDESLEDSAFKLALAVFSGAQYDAVDEAARHLMLALEPNPDSNEKEEKKDSAKPPRLSPLKKGKKISEKLNMARAKLVKQLVSTEYSDKATVELVELDYAAYSPALLKYFWTEFGDLRQPFLDWLCTYAVHARRDMHHRAATAIGALGVLDFDYIRTRVFKHWAFAGTDDDERRKYRQALGNALGALVWDPDRAEDVLGLLNAWVDDGGEALRWAAARAYAQVGLKYPRKAVDQWRRILESEGKLIIRVTDDFGVSIPHPLHMSVIDAMISLFLRALELPHSLRPVYEEALEGLAAWVEEDAKDKNSEQAGLPLFLVLTAIQIPQGDGSGDPDDWPPAMLHIVGTQPDSAYRRALAGMLRRALNHSAYGQMAVLALKLWTECAEKNKFLKEPLTALLKELVSMPNVTERERGRLYINLTRWATRPKLPLEVAKQLLVELNLVQEN